MSLIENVIKNLYVGSKNKPILKQINKYEAERADVTRREHLAQIIADELERKSMNKSATLIRKEEERLKQERVRIEKLIDELVKQLEPDREPS